MAVEMEMDVEKGIIPSHSASMHSCGKFVDLGKIACKFYRCQGLQP